MVDRYTGKDLIIGGFPDWCPQWHEHDRSDYLVLTVEQYETGGAITRKNFSRRFTLIGM